MKTPFSSLILALLVAAILPLVNASESPSLLLQKGIYAEEIERNLDSAIKIYEQIGAEAAASRSVAAQAQYRIAVCYQKQGNKVQAIKLLNELVQQNPSDAAVSAKAREILAELGAAPSTAVSVRRIPLTGTPAWFMAISPDGRFVAYQNWEGDALYVQELATGKTQLVDKDAEITAHSPSARFSPDGQWIAYDIREAAIKIARTDGTEVRKLYQGPEKNAKDGKPGSWIAAGGWSADGSQLIMALWDNDRGQRIAVALDAKTGAATEIAPAPKNKAGARWNISESGQYLARQLDGYPKTIALFDFKSGRDEVVVEYGADRVVGWYANDTKLIYTRTGTQGIDLWVLGITGGKPVDEPRLVSADSVNSFSRGSRRAYPLGVTRDGRIFYTVERGKPAPAELWVLDGFLHTKPTALGLGAEIPPSDLIVGTDRSLRYEKIGLSAKLPAGWGITGANRTGNTGNNFYIKFAVAGAEKATLSIAYRSISSWPEWATVKRPAPGEEEDAWLKKRVDEQQSQVEKGSKEFKRDSAGMASRLVGGHKAVSWSGSFMKNGVPWTQFALNVYSGKSFASITLQTPTAGLDVIRPAYESFVESLRLP